MPKWVREREPRRVLYSTDSLGNPGAYWVSIEGREDENVVGRINLILVGTAESNTWLSKICKELPVRIEENQVTANGKRYSGRDTGYILICPNPINPKRYVVVFSATSSTAMAEASRAYSEMKSMTQPSDSIQLADVGTFEITADTATIPTMSWSTSTAK